MKVVFVICFRIATCSHVIFSVFSDVHLTKDNPLSTVILCGCFGFDLSRSVTG